MMGLTAENQPWSVHSRLMVVMPASDRSDLALAASLE